MTTDSSGRVRDEFTMTEAEWKGLGGTTPPEGYDPKRATQRGEMKWTALAGNGVAATEDVLARWQGVAAAHGVQLLTIHWPDVHFPEFSAVKR